MDQDELDQILQQQQVEVQSQLDLMNEKMENWVVQCFSDLRNRIIDLVSPLGPFPLSLLQCYLLNCFDSIIACAAQQQNCLHLHMCQPCCCAHACGDSLTK